MSTGPSSQLTAASGGHDWLFADPFAYQYSQIPDHVRDLEARSNAGTARDVMCELEGSIPSPAEHEPASSAFFELDGNLPTNSLLHCCTTSPPSPATPAVAELSPENYTPPPGAHQKQQHVANYVKHAEISRGRYANVRLSRKYPLGHAHHRAASESVVQVGEKNRRLRQGDIPSPLVPGPQSAGPKVPHIRGLIPIKTDLYFEPGLMRVEDMSSSTSKKDFDSILKDIVPVTKKKSSWRHSRALNYQDKYEKWGA